MKILRSHKSWQAAQRLQLGDRWNNNDLVFASWDGKPLRPDSVSSQFRNFIKSVGLPSVSIHFLRHTNATLQIFMGVNIRTVSDRLGHAATSMTADIYSHAIKTANEMAADALGDILNPFAKNSE